MTGILLSRNISAIAAMLLLNGCAFNSFMFEARENKPIIIIEHPPNRIAFGGNLNDKDIANAQQVLKMMQRMPYKDYHFKAPLGFVLNSSVSNVDESSFSGATTVSRKETKDESSHSSDVNVNADVGGM